MYYRKLTIDRNALANVTQILQPFTINKTLHVDHVNVTTSKDLFCFFLLFLSAFLSSRWYTLNILLTVVKLDPHKVWIFFSLSTRLKLHLWRGLQVDQRTLPVPQVLRCRRVRLSRPNVRHVRCGELRWLKFSGHERKMGAKRTLTRLTIYLYICLSVCLSVTVNVVGSIVLRSKLYFDCLGDKSTKEFQRCNYSLHREVKKCSVLFVYVFLKEHIVLKNPQCNVMMSSSWNRFTALWRDLTTSSLKTTGNPALAPKP